MCLSSCSSPLGCRHRGPVSLPFKRLFKALSPAPRQVPPPFGKAPAPPKADKPSRMAAPRGASRGGSRHAGAAGMGAGRDESETRRHATPEPHAPARHARATRGSRARNPRRPQG